MFLRRYFFTIIIKALAFIVGIFSPTPEIQLFCCGNAVSIILDYVYQIYVFVPVLIMVGRQEEKEAINCETASKKTMSRRRNIQVKVSV